MRLQLESARPANACRLSTLSQRALPRVAACPSAPVSQPAGVVGFTSWAYLSCNNAVECSGGTKSRVVARSLLGDCFSREKGCALGYALLGRFPESQLYRYGEGFFCRPINSRAHAVAAKVVFERRRRSSFPELRMGKTGYRLHPGRYRRSVSSSHRRASKPNPAINVLSEYKLDDCSPSNVARR